MGRGLTSGLWLKIGQVEKNQMGVGDGSGGAWKGQEKKEKKEKQKEEKT